MGATKTAILTVEKAVVVVIDIQEKLIAAMPEKVVRQIERSVSIIAEGAKVLDVPVFFTEQYPQGLGATLPSLVRLRNAPAVAKTTFSCLGCDEFRSLIEESGRRQVILTGMETHICVYQTALALLDEGYQVWVPQECVCSRSKNNWKNGLTLLRDAGATVTNVETVLFQMLGKAGGDAFKTISRLVK